MTSAILALNSGSSSLKFQVFDAGRDGPPILSGQADRIGSQQALLTCRAGDARPVSRDLALLDHAAALTACADLLETSLSAERIVAVSLRIVYGGPVFADPVSIRARCCTCCAGACRRPNWKMCSIANRDFSACPVCPMTCATCLAPTISVQPRRSITS